MPAIAAAKDDKRIELAPSGAWEVDYAEDSCALRRGFGEAGKEVWLELRRLTGDGFQITVASALQHEASRSADHLRV